MANLTPKQERFCQEYVIDLNGSKAAVRAGYSSKSSKEIASELLTKPNIQDFIQKLRNDISERNRIDIDELVQSMASMVRFDIKDMYDDNGNLLPIPEMPKEARLMIESFDLQEVVADGAVVGVTKKVRTIKKLDAIEKLMKHLGGYERDNSQKQSDISIPIIEWVKE